MASCMVITNTVDVDSAYIFDKHVFVGPNLVSYVEYFLDHKAYRSKKMQIDSILSNPYSVLTILAIMENSNEYFGTWCSGILLNPSSADVLSDDFSFEEACMGVNHAIEIHGRDT